MPEAEHITTEQIIKIRMAEYLDAMNSLDPNRIASFYSTRPEFHVYTDGQRLDRTGLVELIRGMDDALSKFSGVWDYIEVTPLGDQTALAASR